MSTEALVRIENGKARGLTAHDAAVLDEMEGGEYRAVFTVPRGRSVSQMGLFHAFCDHISDNHADDIPSSAVKHILKIEAGAYTVRKLANGTYVRIAKSIAFNKMPAPEFGEFLDRALKAAMDLFGAGLSKAAYAEAMTMTGDPSSAPSLSAPQDHPKTTEAA